MNDKSGATTTETVESSEAPSENFDPKAIFEAEVAALTGADAGAGARGNITSAHAVNPDGTEKRSEPEGGDEGGNEGGNEGATQEAGGSEETEETQAKEPEKSDSELNEKQRNNWKKEALESRIAVEQLRKQMAELAAKLDAPATNDRAPAEINPEPIDLSKLELTPEAKEFLDYTPGFDKLIASIASEQAKLLVEKTLSETQAKRQEEESSREAVAKESEFWVNMESWFTGEYPELSLSEIKSSPDFNDWLNIRKTWVDTQLNGVGRYETSGAQKVYQRFIEEQGLANPKDKQGEPDNAGRLAAARTPSVNKKTQSQTSAPKNIFMEEVERLKASPTQRRFV